MIVKMAKQSMPGPTRVKTIPSSAANPPESGAKVEYVVIALILIAAIIFGAFQIRERAAAHSNPGVVSRSVERVRVHPRAK